MAMLYVLVFAFSILGFFGLDERLLELRGIESEQRWTSWALGDRLRLRLGHRQ